ncbi:MAG: TetR/AcrR family transcriptional regulator [Geminicoccaceae bacterium]|nr:TetR/AcrR family transcriptional regulator [Geminicoccaceae bacterium]
MSDMTTRTRLDDAAIRLFARHGVAGTSVRDIAQSARIADGTLYRHYNSKEEMARCLFERHYGDLARSFAASAAPHRPVGKRLRAVIADAYRLFDDNPDLFGFLLLSQHDHLKDVSEHQSSPVDIVRDLLIDAMTDGEIPECDPEFAASLVFGIALQPAVFTVYGRLHGPLSDRADAVADAALRSLASHAGTH